MADNVYEGMFILDSNRYGHDPEAVSGQINEMIQKPGGEILVSRLWEERRLAYPIKGHRKGTYWLTYFRLDSVRLTAIKRRVPDQRGHFAVPVPQGRSADRRCPGDSCPDGSGDRRHRGSGRGHVPVAAVVVGIDPKDLEVPDDDE